MDLSIVVARILALTYLSAGVAALSGRMTYGRLAEDFEKSPALTFVTGFMALVCGALLVSYHNMWTRDWRVLVTAIGWLSLLKGLTLIACPSVSRIP